MQHKSPHDESLKEAVLTKAIRRAADAWRIDNAHLALLLGMHKYTVSELKQGRTCLQLHTPSWERGLLFLHAFRSLDAYMGGQLVHENSWLRAYNHALGAVPYALLCQAEGLVAVVQYLDAMLGHYH